MIGHLASEPVAPEGPSRPPRTREESSPHGKANRAAPFPDSAEQSGREYASVIFLNTISDATWWALATKAGGEVISADSF
jgi:hypothetical protein